MEDFAIMREEICHIVVNCESAERAQCCTWLRELWIEIVIHFFSLGRCWRHMFRLDHQRKQDRLGERMQLQTLDIRIWG